MRRSQIRQRTETGSIREKERKQWLRRKYGMTPEHYAAMCEAQNNVCKICGRQDPSGRLVVDHCHDSARVRGLLCAQCNAGLGQFGDDPEKLRSAIKYLNES